MVMDQDRVVVITGVTGNLGGAFARFFVQKGFKVAGLDLDEDRINSLSNEWSNGYSQFFKGFVCDITDLEQCKKTFDDIQNELGPIYMLINNAGITHIQRYLETADPIRITQKVMDVNFMGSVHCTHLSLPSLIHQKGIVITISSVAGFAPLLGRSAYSASKHALHGFFESLDAELDDLQFIMVCPGFISVNEQKRSNAAIHQKKKVIGPEVLPDEIVQKTWRAIQKGKKLVTCGRTATLSYLIRRFIPSYYFKRMKENLSKEL